jgi:predicted ATPase/class 3 adenylate cyclase
MASQVKPGRPSSAPTGTVTFLFSDIEGSTVRWEANPDAMASALARHDLVMRATLEAHGAYVFKTIGDAFCAAFATAPDAITAALDAQLALASEDFSTVEGVRVRIALHTGNADERDGDYFGPAVNRVARLLAIVHGGQVLVSGAAAGLLKEQLPSHTSLRDLGEHRLRDLAQAEHVYQVAAPGLQESFPPLRSLDHLSNNLPRRLTSFVGRDAVMADLAALIETHPLVTLVGTGGAGKTRCAIQIGADLLDGSGDGVWLVELAPISDPKLVANAVAQALGVQERPNRPILDTLVAYLKRKRLLLILDNCEHVIEDARRVAAAIVQDCAKVRILATSREPLNISGEETYRMPSLAIPPSAEELFTEGVPQYGAVQLFVDRALSSDKCFALTEENAPHVTEICRRLDGIPLAIELAAARLNVLSSQQLAHKLNERFRVLTGGDRSALPRHQTMRALIDWSYDLLSNDERALFRKLSIFAGGFTLETAAAVCAEVEMDEIAMLDLISSLVEKSLVQAEHEGSGKRYRLLESTRQYAREKLIQYAEFERIARSHATAFVTLAEEQERNYDTTPDRSWIAQVEPEMENWRAVLEWTLTQRNDVATGQRLAAAMRQMWNVFEAAEGRKWIRLALQTTIGDTPDVARLRLGEAHLDARLIQNAACYDAARDALERFTHFGDSRGIAESQQLVGRALNLLGRTSESQPLLQTALEVFRRLKLPKNASWTLENLGFARHVAGDFAGARAYFAEGLATAKATGSQRMVAVIAATLAEVLFRNGDTLATLQPASESIDGFRAIGDKMSVAMGCGNMAAYLVALDRYDEALPYAREALKLSLDLQHDAIVATALQHLAAITALGAVDEAEPAREAYARAARVLGYVDACLIKLQSPRQYTEENGYDRIVVVLRDTLGEDEVTKLMAEGSTWSEDQAVAEAMLI